MKKAKFLVEKNGISLKVYRHQDGVDVDMTDDETVLSVSLCYEEIEDLHSHLQQIKWDIDAERKENS